MILLKKSDAGGYRNMKKIVKGIIKTLFYFVICLILTVFESIKYVFVGSSLIGKIVVVGGYSTVISLSIFKPRVLLILIVIILVVEFVVAINISKSEESRNTNQSSNKNYNDNVKKKIPFFDGMPLDEAKCEYRKLMKLYHPDNAGGDVEMSQKISAAFSEYKTVYGR